MYPVTSDSFLSAEFLSAFEGKLPKNRGPLFEIIYLRTYARWREELGRREKFPETCQRVVEYICSLYSGPKTREERISFAEHLYEKIFNLKMFPAGRTLWIGGSKAAETHPESNFNCSFIEIEDMECFAEIFHLLMCGCGVGFSVEKVNIAKLPPIFGGKVLYYDDYVPVAPEDRLEDTAQSVINDQLYMSIGDSKEGWVNALRIFLSAFQNEHINGIHINYDSIRPKGERIKTFGGHAPGPEGMQLMFTNVAKLFKKFWNQKMRPIHATDLCNFIASNVIVGGNRRSSEIALCSSDDEEMIAAKSPGSIEGNDQRQMSNNSVIFDDKPSLMKIHEVFERIKFNGEPGFFNRYAASKRRPNARGLNPCAEIILDSRGFCNLSTVVVSNHIKNGTLDTDDLYDSFKLAAQVGVLLTNVTVSLQRWNDIQKRDRLIGVSMTGFMDALDACHMSFKSFHVGLLLEGMRKAANDAATDYAFEMRIPRPLLVTAVKPEGTLSQLPTCSSGLHRAYAPYFIRRVSAADTDPVAKALMQVGVPYIVNPKKIGRIVFEFPIKTRATTASDEESAIDQYDRYLLFMKKYVDHNASCTLYIGENEYPAIEEKVLDNWDNTVAVAWLPKMVVETVYPYAPYKQISEDEYNERMINMPDLSEVSNMVDHFELNELFEDELGDEEDKSCATGVCPRR